MPLPHSSEVGSLLELQGDFFIEGLLEKSLLQPLRGFLHRPSKQVRSEMVRIGFLMGKSARAGSDSLISERDSSLCHGLSTAIESLHAGSLVIDDIQDDGKMRRGEPCLHIIHGIPLALNAGNWLYFWSLKLLKSMALEPHMELRLYQLFHNTLLQAHFGQALDLGAPVALLPQNLVKDTYISTVKLKSGALLALALVAGATLAQAEEECLVSIREFGLRFGVGLQMYDDLGSKKFDDLALGRLSWVWAMAASVGTADDYQTFRFAVAGLPDRKPLEHWFAQNDFFSTARASAKKYVEDAIQEIGSQLPVSNALLSAIKETQRIHNILENAYETS